MDVVKPVEYQGISHWQAILHDIHSFIEMTCAQCWLLGSSVLNIGIFSMMISPSAGYLGHPFGKSETRTCLYVPLFLSPAQREASLTKGMFRTAKPTLIEQASRSLNVGKRKGSHLCLSKEN
jgi:methionine aminopeptidase